MSAYEEYSEVKPTILDLEKRAEQSVIANGTVYDDMKSSIKKDVDVYLMGCYNERILATDSSNCTMVVEQVAKSIVDPSPEDIVLTIVIHEEASGKSIFYDNRSAKAAKRNNRIIMIRDKELKRGPVFIRSVDKMFYFESHMPIAKCPTSKEVLDKKYLAQDLNRGSFFAVFSGSKESIFDEFYCNVNGITIPVLKDFNGYTAPSNCIKVFVEENVFDRVETEDGRYDYGDYSDGGYVFPIDDVIAKPYVIKKMFGLEVPFFFAPTRTDLKTKVQKYIMNRADESYMSKEEYKKRSDEKVRVGVDRVKKTYTKKEFELKEKLMKTEVLLKDIGVESKKKFDEIVISDKRKLDELERNYNNQIASMNTLHETEVRGLKNEITHLENELKRKENTNVMLSDREKLIAEMEDKRRTERTKRMESEIRHHTLESNYRIKEQMASVSEKKNTTETWKVVSGIFAGVCSVVAAIALTYTKLKSFVPFI